METEETLPEPAKASTNSYESSILTFVNYANGQLKECMFGSPCSVVTPYGSFAAHYDDGGDRTRYSNSIAFYNDGTMKRLALQDPVQIQMESAAYPAQNLMFHKSGKIKRIFPLNGQTTGFWTEKNEYDLAEPTKIEVGGFVFEEKVISIQFYESEAVKSITFWPQARPKVKVQIESESESESENSGVELEITCRHGISFYEDGKIASVEPAKPVMVPTPIGELKAYDSAPVGVHGDLNSLQFDPNGNVMGLKNSTGIITVKRGGEEVETIRHARTPHWCNENLTMPLPMAIAFEDGIVSFGEDKSFVIDDYEFEIDANRIKIPTFHC